MPSTKGVVPTVGLEPTLSGSSVQSLYQLEYVGISKALSLLSYPYRGAGLEPASPCKSRHQVLPPARRPYEGHLIVGSSGKAAYPGLEPG